MYVTAYMKQVSSTFVAYKHKENIRKMKSAATVALLGVALTVQ